MKLYFCLIAFLVLLASCQAQESAREKPPAHPAPRMLQPGTPLSRAYGEAERSIEGCERFIGQYSHERDLCAGAQLRIAQLHAKQGETELAIEAYRKAIHEYAEEIVPDVNATFTVKDWALFRVGLLYQDSGERDKAMEIFGSLVNEAWDGNTRRDARTHYLETKQSHLKLNATVSVPKRTYSLGESIPVSVLVRNDTKESVIFRCFARIMRKRDKTYGAIAPRTDESEITLPAGSDHVMSATFLTERHGLEPGEWEIDCNLGGIAVITNSVAIRILNSN